MQYDIHVTIASLTSGLTQWSIEVGILTAGYLRSDERLPFLYPRPREPFPEDLPLVDDPLVDAVEL